MKRIAVVEDEPQERGKLQEFLARYEREHSENFMVSVYEDGLFLVENYVSQFDVILMDIQMKLVDGMKAAREIRRQDTNVIIIFITNLSEYAIQGYDVDARGYLLKPLTYKVFERQMDRVCQSLNGREDQMLSIELSSGVERIRMGDIRYVESHGHYLDIHLEGRTIHFLCSLKEVESELDPSRFCRCNHGILVNLQHVQRMEGVTVYVEGEALPVSRSKRGPFLSALTDYMGDNGHVR